MVSSFKAMSRISGLRNDMNKEPFIKNEKSTDVLISILSKQNIIVPLILDINVRPEVECLRTCVRYRLDHSTDVPFTHLLFENNFDFVLMSFLSNSFGSLDWMIFASSNKSKRFPLLQFLSHLSKALV